MTPSEAIEFLKVIREKREWDEQGESWTLDADALEQYILESVESEETA